MCELQKSSVSAWQGPELTARLPSDSAVLFPLQDATPAVKLFRVGPALGLIA